MPMPWCSANVKQIHKNLQVASEAKRPALKTAAAAKPTAAAAKSISVKKETKAKPQVAQVSLLFYIVFAELVQNTVYRCGYVTQ